MTALAVCAAVMGLGALLAVSNVAAAHNSHRQGYREPSMTTMFLGFGMMILAFFVGVIVILVTHE